MFWRACSLEIARRVQWAKLTLAFAQHVEEARGPFDRLRHRLRLQQRIGGDQLLCLGKRSVDHGDLALRKPHTNALRTRLKPFGREEYAGLRHFLNEAPAALHKLRARRHARLGVLVSFEQSDETHCCVSFWFLRFPARAI